MTPECEQAEREAFEKWYAIEYQCRVQKSHYSRIRQRYKFDDMQDSWIAFKARATIAHEERERLMPYVQHLPECAVNAPDYCDDGTEHCDCDLDAALAKEANDAKAE